MRIRLFALYPEGIAAPAQRVRNDVFMMSDVKIVRSVKRKTVAIQIMGDGRVVVTVPYFFLGFKIERILKEKAGWIAQKQAEVKERNKLKLKKKNEDATEELFWYLGEKYPVKIRRNQKNILEFDGGFYLASSSTRNVKVYLQSWYKQRALKVIKERVGHFSRISGLEFNALAITSAETRWGSCSSDRNLNFNWKLIMAPLPVIDYVVAHELAHLMEMNHSKDFWEQVRKMFPMYREYRTWLKRHGDALII